MTYIYKYIYNIHVVFDASYVLAEQDIKLMLQSPSETLTLFAPDDASLAGGFLTQDQL